MFAENTSIAKMGLRSLHIPHNENSRRPVGRPAAASITRQSNNA